MAPESEAPAVPPLAQERIRAQLRKWQERLLDLTKANPLLGVNRSRVSKLRIVDPDPHVLFDHFAVDEVTLHMPMVSKKSGRSPESSESESPRDETEYVVEPGDVAFEAKPLDLLRRLRRIYDNARTTVEERGVTTLYLTFGALRWQDDSFGASASPLRLAP